MTLPPPPDFAQLSSAARRRSSRSTRLLALMGNLMFSWSNNESLLIYVIMLLLRTSEVNAAIVYATLNTSRARLDLVRRLAKTNLTDPAIRAALDDVIERFIACNRLRNEFSHSMYALDADGDIAQMRALRITETRRRISFGEATSFDDRRIGELVRLLRDLARLNRDLWTLLPRLRATMAVRGDGAPASRGTDLDQSAGPATC